MDTKVSQKSSPCPSFKILQVHTSGTEACIALRESFILD
jgi:hypothetical protein